MVTWKDMAPTSSYIAIFGPWMVEMFGQDCWKRYVTQGELWGFQRLAPFPVCLLSASYLRSKMWALNCCLHASVLSSWMLTLCSDKPNLMLNFKDTFIIILCVWVLHLHGCFCITCVIVVQGGQKASDFLELELEMVVNHCGSAGNWTQGLWKSSQCF